MQKIPDNLKCLEHNGGYYSHWLMAKINKGDENNKSALEISCIHLESLDKQPLMRNFVTDSWPAKDIKSIPKLIGRRNPAMECNELLFKDLPEAVKRKFREFEHMLVKRQMEVIDLHLGIVQ